MGHIYGYARVSTIGQSYEEQVKDLKKAGSEKIFKDKASGKNTLRPGFEKLSEALLPGDTVVICKLDRIGRNIQDLIGIISNYNDKGISFKVLDNATLDTTTSQGKLMFNIFAAFADYERELILERTARGREAAKAKGKIGGRKKSISAKKIESINTLIEGGMEVGEACKQLGVSRASYYRLKNKDIVD